MTVDQAIGHLHSKYPDLSPIGYWEDGDSIILNTKPVYGPGCDEVCLYEVLPDGRVRGTTPMRTPVIAHKAITRLSDC